MRPTRRQLLKIYGVALPAAIYSLTATRRRMTTNSEECARGSKQEVCGRHKGGRGKDCVRACVCVQKACQVVAYKIYARLANVVRLSGEKGLHTHTAHKFLLCGKDGRNSPAHSLLCYKACVAAFWAHSAMKCQMAEERCRRQVMKQSAFAK